MTEGQDTRLRHTIVFLTNSFSSFSGGRTASIFHRAKLFQSMGHRVCIATRNVKPAYRGIFRSLCDKYDLHDVEFLNPYEFFAEEPIFGDGPAGDPDSDYVEKPSMADGEDADVHVETLEDLEGHVFRKTWVDADGRVLESEFRTPEGRVYLRFVPNERGRQERRLWYRKDGSVRVFSTLRTLWAYWIAQIAQDHENPLFFAEEHSANGALVGNPFVEEPLKVVATVHSTFFGPPYTYGSGLRPYLVPVLEHIEEFAAVVAITEQERAHICNYFGEHENLVCITHPQKALAAAGDVQKSPHRIVLCTRLAPIKRVDDAVVAAVRAHEEVPDLELLIYGGGPEEERLRALIAEQGAGDYVRLMGYTDKPLQAVASGALTLSTSEFEGCPLSVYEAMMMGTPVVCYDYLYGPRYYIEDGVNGRIVANGDVEALAGAIVELLQDPQELARMSAAARDMDAKFSPETIRRQWEELFARIDAKPLAQAAREQFALVRDVRALGEDAEWAVDGTVPADGSATWRLRVHVGTFGDVEPTRFFLFFDSCRRIDLRDELFVEGTLVKGTRGSYAVEFSLTAPVSELMAFRGDGTGLRVETEFGCHAEMTPIALG